MSVFPRTSLVQTLLEQANERKKLEITTEQRKALKSKIQGLNNHLEAIIQKKIRLDLEIRRSRKKLSKLQQQTKTVVKAAVELEQFDPTKVLTEDQVRKLEEKMGPQVVTEYKDLDFETDRAEVILKESESLPLYE